MAQGFYPIDPNNPYAVPAGLTRAQTTQGGTVFVDGQGNIYIPTGSGYQLNTNPSVQVASSPIAMNSPAPLPDVSAPSQPPTNSTASNLPQTLNMGGYDYTLQGQNYVYSAPGSGSQSVIAANSDQIKNAIAATLPQTPSTTAQNSVLAGLPNMVPGSTGDSVKALQDWLVQSGYMTQAQVDTGYGTYGPQTTAAVAAWQTANGIDTRGNPGYFGPQSRAFVSSNPTSVNSAGVSLASSGGGGTGGGGGGYAPTGNSQLDAILGSLQDLITQNKASIPPGLQITPALTAQFLAWAHQVVDPQTQQLINQHITALNSNLQQLQTDYQNSQGQTIQNFGMQLASGDNSMAGSGTAFSGLRNLTDQNLVNSTNRSLSTLAADAGNTAGQTLNAGAAQVGSANANQFNLPNLPTATVGLGGGSYGRSNVGGTTPLNYNPANYTMGTDISTGVSNVGTQQANYLNQYGTLAGNNSGLTMSQIIGGVTNLPQGYQIPANLQ